MCECVATIKSTVIAAYMAKQKKNTMENEYESLKIRIRLRVCLVSLDDNAPI